MSPAEFWIAFWKWAGSVVGITILSVLAIATLVIGCWQAGWWFTNHNATRNYQITQNGVSNQDTLRSRIDSDFATFNSEGVQLKAYPALASAIRSEQDATGNDICSLAPQVTTIPLPSDQAAWVSANCADGSLSSSSLYYVPSAPGVMGN